MTIASAVGACSWYIRGEQIDYLKQQIASYEQVNKMPLKPTVEALQKAAKSVDLRLTNLTDNDKLKSEVKNLRSYVEKLESEKASLGKNLKEQAKDISALNTKILKFTGEKFDFRLRTGESIHLGGEGNSFGLVSIIGSTAYLTFYNEKKQLDVGQFFEFNKNGEKCKLYYVSKVYYNSLSFSSRCNKT
ncbi:MAG: hypothetical protein ACPGUD_04180 [Parashewanella sp.]